MQQQQLERNTAFLTTISTLHSLFVSCNGNVKWGGVAFLVNNKKITPLFAELSGEINFNNSPDKERSDEEKIIKQFFYMRYHGNVIAIFFNIG
ncbi:hypothetical protein G6F37_004551 [Rhizopus arrhizus]|nr:hypothetical protein G6F37_004551 [Rhizopus arrhizus]